MSDCIHPDKIFVPVLYARVGWLNAKYIMRTGNTHTDIFQHLLLHSRIQHTPILGNVVHHPVVYRRANLIHLMLHERRYNCSIPLQHTMLS